jgi:hypothetical protein
MPHVRGILKKPYAQGEVTVKIKQDPKRRHCRHLEEALPEKLINEVEIKRQAVSFGQT